MPTEPGGSGPGPKGARPGSERTEERRGDSPKNFDAWVKSFEEHVVAVAEKPGATEKEVNVAMREAEHQMKLMQMMRTLIATEEQSFSAIFDGPKLVHQRVVEKIQPRKRAIQSIDRKAAAAGWTANMYDGIGPANMLADEIFRAHGEDIATGNITAADAAKYKLALEQEVVMLQQYNDMFVAEKPDSFATVKHATERVTAQFQDAYARVKKVYDAHEAKREYDRAEQQRKADEARRKADEETRKNAWKAAFKAERDGRAMWTPDRVATEFFGMRTDQWEADNAQSVLDQRVAAVQGEIQGRAGMSPEEKQARIAEIADLYTKAAQAITRGENTRARNQRERDAENAKRNAWREAFNREQAERKTWTADKLATSYFRMNTTQWEADDARMFLDTAYGNLQTEFKNKPGATEDEKNARINELNALYRVVAAAIQAGENTRARKQREQDARDRARGTGSGGRRTERDTDSGADAGHGAWQRESRERSSWDARRLALEFFKLTEEQWTGRNAAMSVDARYYEMYTAVRSDGSMSRKEREARISELVDIAEKLKVAIIRGENVAAGGRRTESGPKGEEWPGQKAFQKQKDETMEMLRRGSGAQMQAFLNTYLGLDPGIFGKGDAEIGKAIKKAYRKKALEQHPDRFSAQGEQKVAEMNDRLKMLNAIYEYLKDYYKIK